MQVYPLLVAAIFLALIGLVGARKHPAISHQSTFLPAAEAMVTYHQAAVAYAQQPNSVPGTVPSSTIAGFLPPGATIPSGFVSVITAPGTVTTYTVSTAASQPLTSQLIQQLTAYGLYAGIVQAGQIVPIGSQSPVAALGGAPNGSIAIETIL